MRLTSKNLVHHELIGLRVEVTKSRNDSMAGIRGKIVDESMKMLVVEMDGEEKKVPKDVSTFLFTLPDGAKVEVEGRRLVARPEDRIYIKVKR